MNYNTEIENLKFNIPKNYRTLFAVIGGSETISDEEVDENTTIQQAIFKGE